MIQAKKIIDIAKENSTKVHKVSRATVQHHCRTGHFQKVILPIKRTQKQQKAAITMYLTGKKIMQGEEVKNPVELVRLRKLPKGNTQSIIAATYWCITHFFKLPAGMKLVDSEDPVFRTYKPRNQK